MGGAAVFYGISTLLVFFSLMVITRRNPVASAVYLIGTLFLVAALFAYLSADFIAAIQVLIYAGAIMVLFLFVIMLLNIDPELLKGGRISGYEIFVLLLTIVGFIAMAVMIGKASNVAMVGEMSQEKILELGGNTRVVGLKLFRDYLWPFELASILILLAIVASVVIAKKDKAPATSKGKSA